MSPGYAAEADASHHSTISENSPLNTCMSEPDRRCIAGCRGHVVQQRVVDSSDAICGLLLVTLRTDSCPRARTPRCADEVRRPGAR
jgi:hypothetical protein